MQNKLVVYTALFGEYDDLIEPKDNFPGCDFVCFTDQKNLSSKIWNIQYIESKNKSAILLNRHYKMMPHIHFKEYQYSMYIDGNVRLLSSPLPLVDKYLSTHKIASPAHEHRSCIYREAEECIRRGKASKFDVESQMNFYRGDGFPQNYGLREMNVILREHNDGDVVGVMEEWWKQFNCWSKRDQLSFFYAVWKNSITIGELSETTRNVNKYFFLEVHKCLPVTKKVKRRVKRFIYSFLNIINLKKR